jgi:hypothetical protein
VRISLLQAAALHGTHGRMCSQIRPEWTVSLEPLRAKLSGKAYIEPTDSMVLENYLSLEPVLSINRVGFRGSILKVLGTLGQAVDAALCCQRQCPLGRCESSFPIAVAPSVSHTCPPNCTGCRRRLWRGTATSPRLHIKQRFFCLARCLWEASTLGCSRTST